MVFIDTSILFMHQTNPLRKKKQSLKREGRLPFQKNCTSVKADENLSSISMRSIQLPREKTKATGPRISNWPPKNQRSHCKIWHSASLENESNT